MPEIRIEGIGSVRLDDSFLSQSPEMQDAIVQDIARQHKAKGVASDISGQKDYSKMGLAEFAGETASNILPSAGRLAKDVVQPIIHPIETATNIGRIGKGVLQKLGIMEGKDAEQYADAVGKFLVDRYGSGAAISKTMATDPVGMAADIATLLTGGGAIVRGLGAATKATGAVRAGEAIGRTGQAALAIGDAANPLNLAGQAVKGTARAGATIAGSMLTGTGGRPITEAAMAGAKALSEPSQTKAFLENYTGKVDPAQAVTIAKDAVSDLIKKRGQEYVSELRNVKGQSSLPLSYNKIDNAINTQINKFYGKVLDESLQGVVDTVKDRVEAWKVLPQVFQTPLGFDALKKNIADVLNLPGNKDQFGRLTKQGNVVKNIEKAIVQTISEADPKYANVMKAYSEASDIIDNLQRELSLGRNANVDTGLRKLQSVLRDNVNTSYGRRVRLAEFLRDNGATTLLSALAGQSMSTLVPRGLAAKMLAMAEGLFGLSHGVGSEQLLKAAGALTLSSPAVMGGAAFAGGAAASPLYAAAKAGRRIGLGPSRVGLLSRTVGTIGQ